MLKISGKPMLVQSILTHPKHQTTKVIITKENKSYKILKKSINKYFPKSKIVTLNKSTKGQAITCLEGLKNEDMELPLTIGSCDVGLIYQNKKFFKLFNDKKTDVIVWAVKNNYEAIQNPNQFGWIETNNKNNINNVSVKKPTKDTKNDPIVLGTFTFKKTKYFVRSIQRTIQRKALINKEFYVDTSINDAIKLGYNCKIFLVDSYLPWGNPNDLKTFKYWQEYFHLWKNHPYKIKKTI